MDKKQFKNRPRPTDRTPEHIKRFAKEKLMNTFAVKPKKIAVITDPVGKAQAAWISWKTPQRELVLENWCKVCPEPFLSKEWYQLSAHVRKSIKRFFRVTPRAESLEGLRYPEPEVVNA